MPAAVGQCRWIWLDSVSLLVDLRYLLSAVVPSCHIDLKLVNPLLDPCVIHGVLDVMLLHYPLKGVFSERTTAGLRKLGNNCYTWCIQPMYE